MADVKFNPYLNFEGTTREALEFYRQVFGGTLEVTTFSDVPGMPVPEGYEDKVMHAVLTADDVTIMASEGAPGGTITMGDNVSLSLSGDDEERLSGFFGSLSDGGTVFVPLAASPWGDLFGTVRDRYGINWLVNILKNQG